jgi:hypothetical protein
LGKEYRSFSSSICNFLHCDILFAIRTNKMRTFQINVLIQLQCLQHVSTIQVFILRKTCTCSFILQCFRKAAVFLGRKICSVSWSPTHA